MRNDGDEMIRKSCNITPSLDSFPLEKKPFYTATLIRDSFHSRTENPKVEVWYRWDATH